MTSPTPLSFIHQDLRGRSFRRQYLNNAWFRGCDLRGCDFSQAQLRQATFTDCRMGYSFRKLTGAAMVTMIAAIGLFHAISTLIFSAMGTLADNPAWPYVITLYGVLGLATGSAGWQSLSGHSRGLALLLTGVSTGALMGFFYGGRLTDDNPQVAIAGAMLLGTLGLITVWKAPPALSRTLLGTLGAIAAYGFAFLLWTDGSSLVTTGSWVPGLIRMALALVAIGITLRSLRASWAGSKTYGTTSFRETDLTACRFIDTALTHCDMDESFTLLE